jgi:hypothetical protein
MAKEAQGMRFSPKEIAVTVIATVLAFAGLFVEDPRIVFLCLGVSWAAFIYLCVVHPGSHFRRATIAILIAACYGGTMYLFHEHTLEKQREDVYQHLEFSHNIPLGEEDDPMHTVFTVTNGSSYEISKRHVMGCSTTFAVGHNGTMGIVSHDPVTFNPDGSFMGWHDVRPNITASSTLQPGQDAESVACLSWFNFGGGGTDCADVTMIFWYSLETQRDIDQEKKLRYVAKKGKDGRFLWSQQPINSKEQYCASLYKGPPDPKLR